MEKKKKVGIITFHNSYNCGSMLQTYALSTVLTQMHVENEVIDFANEGQRKVYSIYSKEKSLKSLIKNVIIFFHKKKIASNFNSYENFKTKNFPLSKKKYVKCETLSDENYDIVITGSDQVFNITIADGDDAYFLPWVKKARKVAYAPSFGAKNIMKNTTDVEKYRAYLREFDFLSIRENNGQKWIEELIHKRVPVLLDPTLLLSREDYEMIVDDHIKLPQRYIFYYAPGYHLEINKLVKKISKKYQLPVIAFNAKNFFVKGMNFSSFELVNIENPSVYLALIKHASLVITTSFHGTIFSTIFRKKFWTIKNGAMYEDDDRAFTLMQCLKLEERMILTSFDDTFDYLKEVDYHTYQKELIKGQKVAKEYLEESLR